MFKKVIFLGILTTAITLAQGSMGQQGGMGQGGDMGGGSRGGRDSGMGGDMGGMGGGGMRAIPTPMERLSNTLNLNKDQKKQVKSIMDDAQKDATPLKEEMLKQRQAIAQAVAAGKSQDDLSGVINEYASSQTKMTLIELGAFNKIYQTLDKDQQAKAPGILAMMNGIFKPKNWDSNPQ